MEKLLQTLSGIHGWFLVEIRLQIPSDRTLVLALKYARITVMIHCHSKKDKPNEMVLSHGKVVANDE